MTHSHPDLVGGTQAGAPQPNSTDDSNELDTLRHRLPILIPPTIFLMVIAWRGTTWWGHILIAAWTSYFFLCATSLFHEFTHRYDVTQWRMFAQIIGTFILTPSRAYRESHMRHHAYLNRPIDWELWPYSDPHCSRSFRRAFVWVDLLGGMFTSPWVYGRIFFSRKSPLSAPASRQIFWEYVVIVLFWGAVLTAVALTDQWRGFLISWALPWYIAGVLQSGRKFTEHLGMSSYDPLRGTRTVFGGNWFTQVCSWLNSDIFVHGPHHRTPKVTADELMAYAREMQDTRADLPFFRTYTAATLDMLPHMFLNPGVGENAARREAEHSRDMSATA